MSTHMRAWAPFTLVLLVVSASCFAHLPAARAALPDDAARFTTAGNVAAQTNAVKADGAQADVAQANVAPASAQVSEVARELVCDCPDCGKQALDQCPNCEIGRKYRAVIAGQLKQGRTKAQIIEYFGDTYGEHILGTPRQAGFGRAAFTLPALAVFVGLLPLSLVLRRRKREAESDSFDAPSGVASPQSAPAKSAADDPRVAAALRDYDF